MNTGESHQAIPEVALIKDTEQASALMQPERLRLLAALVTPDSASGLARRFALPRQRLNYHLRELERVGLLDLVAERRRGNCTERLLRATARSYVVSPEVIGALADAPALAHDRFNAWHLVQLGARTIKEVSALLARGATSGKRFATLALDADIRFADPTMRARFGQEVTAAVAALVAKYHDENAPGGQACRFVAAAYQKP